MNGAKLTDFIYWNRRKNRDWQGFGGYGGETVACTCFFVLPIGFAHPRRIPMGQAPVSPPPPETEMPVPGFRLNLAPFGTAI